MSMTICSGCHLHFDSDSDPECFVEIGDMKRRTSTIILCESCRDEHQAEQDYAPWEREET